MTWDEKGKRMVLERNAELLGYDITSSEWNALFPPPAPASPLPFLNNSTNTSTFTKPRAAPGLLLDEGAEREGGGGERMERGRESEDNGGGGGVGEWFTGAADAGYADGALRDMARDLEAVDAAWERWNGRGGGVGGGSGGNFSGGVGGGGGRKHGREARVEGQARVEGAHSGQSGPAGVCQDRAQQDGAEQPTKRARVCQNESAAGGACDEEERRAGVGAAKNLDTVGADAVEHACSSALARVRVTTMGWARRRKTA